MKYPFATPFTTPLTFSAMKTFGLRPFKRRAYWKKRSSDRWVVPSECLFSLPHCLALVPAVENA